MAKPVLFFIICNVIILLFAILSVVHGIMNMKWCKDLPDENRKSRILHMIVSSLHMCSGLLILIMYLIVVIIIII